MITSEHRQSLSEPPDIATASDDYRSRFAGPVGEFFLERQTSHLLTLTSQCLGKSVLDVGGGHAQSAAPLARNGYDVTVLGSDSTCQRQLSRVMPTDAYQFEAGDLLNLPFPSRHFDISVAFRLMAHLPMWPRLIQELCRVSRHGVVVDYADSDSVNRLQRRLFGLKKSIEGNTRPFHCLRQSQVADCFKEHSFHVVAVEKQFLLPMALHRATRCRTISMISEQFFRSMGLTALWGSPTIVLAQPVNAG